MQLERMMWYFPAFVYILIILAQKPDIIRCICSVWVTGVYLAQKPDIIRCIRSNGDRHWFFLAEIQNIFGTEYMYKLYISVQFWPEDCFLFHYRILILIYQLIFNLY